MATRFRPIAIVFIGLLCLGVSRCSIGRMKMVPEYHGVDPRAEGYVKEFKELAKIQGIIFKSNVTIGFKGINEPNVIGICTAVSTFQEIDLDLDFWEHSTELSRLSLALHEMGHCYCGREHDYRGKAYPTPDEINPRDKSTGPGYYKDGCPRSFMFPVILDDSCVVQHYNDYAVELFQGCETF
jgi:hypothetical protein